MAKYRVLEKSYINLTVVEVGEIVDYDGIPGPNLELVKDSKVKTDEKIEEQK